MILCKPMHLKIHGWSSNTAIQLACLLNSVTECLLNELHAKGHKAEQKTTAVACGCHDMDFAVDREVARWSEPVAISARLLLRHLFLR